MKQPDLYLAIGRTLCRTNMPILLGGAIGLILLEVIILFSGDDALCYLLIAGPSLFVNGAVICAYFLIISGIFALIFCFAGLVMLGIGKYMGRSS